jgi:hypothetical protein
MITAKAAAMKMTTIRTMTMITAMTMMIMTTRIATTTATMPEPERVRGLARVQERGLIPTPARATAQAAA